MQIQTTLNCRGTLVDLSTPRVMGILNLTPDSFFDGGKFTERDSILRRVELMLHEGATFIDVGAVSSRPGAKTVSAEEETDRLMLPLRTVLEAFPDALCSIDTTNATVAELALKAGAAMINDITAGRGNEKMPEVVAKYHVPYVVMHMQGNPETMQQNPHYADVVKEVLEFFVERIAACKKAGINDVVLDPGFGFGKTKEHNFTLLKHLDVFKITGLPVLAGISRKGMVYKTLGTDADGALNGTTALHMVALQNGAKILRVHDVKEAVQCVRLCEELKVT